MGPLYPIVSLLNKSLFHRWLIHDWLYAHPYAYVNGVKQRIDPHVADKSFPLFFAFVLSLVSHKTAPLSRMREIFDRFLKTTLFSKSGA